MNEARVVLEGVAKHWDASSGLAAVSAELRAGEVTVVRGRSGSGKSTLLAILAGWCTPDAGRVVRLGEWAGDRLAAVVGHGGRAAGARPGRGALRRARTSTRCSGWAASRRRSATNGSRRCSPRSISATSPAACRARCRSASSERVAVARAAIIDPVLLLADEPTCHQDADHGQRVVDVLHRLTAHGTAVLIASHDPLVVDRADHLIVLDT